MIILVDMDGVLADFEAGFLAAWRKAFPEEPFIALAERSTFRLIDDYPERLVPQVREVYWSPGFFRNLAPIPGGREALEAMRGQGHDVFLCTAPLQRYQHCVPEKYEWVEEHLGHDWTKRMVLTRDKTLVQGDLLIDDKPEVTGAAVPTWEHVLYHQPYNRAVAGRRRLTWESWREVVGVGHAARRGRAAVG